MVYSVYYPRMGKQWTIILMFTVYLNISKSLIIALLSNS